MLISHDLLLLGSAQLMATEDGKRRKRQWKKPTEPCDSSARTEDTLPPSSLVSSKDTPLEIDGSVMEGGGQILRIAMAASCVLRLPVRVVKIRAGRQNPGLRPQHLTGIQLVCKLCGGHLSGDHPGSSEITFHPGPLSAGQFTADTGTAGSTCLLQQVALPCLLFASGPSRVVLKGGTNADMAPPIDYMTQVFSPIAAKFGVEYECQLKKRGFYPRGGGEVILAVSPVKHLRPVTMVDPGHITKVKVHSFVAGVLPLEVAKQMARAAMDYLQRQLPGTPVEVVEVKESNAQAFGNGSAIIAVAETSTGCLFGESANGEKGVPGEETGRTVGKGLVQSLKSGGCVDEHLQDQLVILMALAKGRSAIRVGPITLHTTTAIHIAQLITKAKFNIQKVEGEKDVHVIECEGIGHENAST